MSTIESLGVSLGLDSSNFASGAGRALSSLQGMVNGLDSAVVATTGAGGALSGMASVLGTVIKPIQNLSNVVLGTLGSFVRLGAAGLIGAAAGLAIVPIVHRIIGAHQTLRQTLEGAGESLRGWGLGALQFYMQLGDNILAALAPLFPSIVAIFESAAGGAAGAWGAFVEYWNASWSVFLDLVAPAIVGFAGLFESGISFAIGLIQNWRNVSALAVVSVELSLVRFANQFIHFFSEVLPVWVDFFGTHTREVLMTAFDYILTVLINLGQNIRDLFTAIWDYIASGGTKAFNFKPTGLTEGFKSVMSELPKIAEREMGPLEAALAGELEALGNAVGADMAPFIKAPFDDFDKKVNDFKNTIKNGLKFEKVVKPEEAGITTTQTAGAALQFNTAAAFSAENNRKNPLEEKADKQLELTRQQLVEQRAATKAAQRKFRLASI